MRINVIDVCFYRVYILAGGEIRSKEVNSVVSGE